MNNLSCSVIIPCHNEIQNIEKCIHRIPKIGSFTEIIIVDDGSTDSTGEVVEKIIKENSTVKNIKLIRYFPRRGKAFAIKSAFNIAVGDIFITLDADMSVAPEDISKFFNVLNETEASFINGTRMIYPESRHLMHQLRFIGNHFFSIILSWLMEQRITDALCGTKALFRKDYAKIKMKYCRWGDFDLLLGAAESKLRIIEIPIYYHPRLRGKTKMSVLKDGLIFLFVIVYWFLRIKLRIWR